MRADPWLLASALTLLSSRSLAVYLVSPTADDPTTRETSSRLYAELAADGVAVEQVAARPEGPLEEPIVELEATRVVVTLPGVAPNEPASVVVISVPDLESKRTSAVLALRASEMLSAWRRRRDEVRSRPAPPAEAPRKPASQSRSAAPPVPPPRGRFFAHLGIGPSWSEQASPALALVAQGGVRLKAPLQVGLTGIFEPTSHQVSSGEASAAVYIHTLMLEPRVLIALHRALELRVGPSIGALLLTGEGEAPEPERAHAETAAALSLAAGAGLHYQVGAFSVGLDARVVFALPTPVVVIDDAAIPFARPWLQGNAAIEARW